MSDPRLLETLNARTRWAKYIGPQDPDTGCVPWLGGKDSDGYGAFGINNGDGTWRQVKAHRLSLASHLGRALERGEQACHRCDNPPCINPDHLFVGTAVDNMHDRHAKRRDARGERSGKARFTEADVQSIRARLAAGEKPTGIARSMGCSLSAIEHIKYRRVWAWL